MVSHISWGGGCLVVVSCCLDLKYSEKATWGKGLFGSQFQVRVHHGDEVTGAGACGRWSYDIQG